MIDSGCFMCVRCVWKSANLKALKGTAEARRAKPSGAERCGLFPESQPEPSPGPRKFVIWETGLGPPRIWGRRSPRQNKNNLRSVRSLCICPTSLGCPWTPMHSCYFIILSDGNTDLFWGRAFQRWASYAGWGCYLSPPRSRNLNVITFLRKEREISASLLNRIKGNETFRRFLTQKEVWSLPVGHPPLLPRIRRY